MRYDRRPIDETPVHTAVLPPTPLRLFADGTSDGVGPSGTRHDRFRAWKEDLRDA